MRVAREHYLYSKTSNLYKKSDDVLKYPIESNVQRNPMDLQEGKGTKLDETKSFNSTMSNQMLLLFGWNVVRIGN